MSNEAIIALLKNRVRVIEGRGNASAGVVRKLKRQIRNLSK